ncbi:pyridoxal phosphate-dependent transferase, partial [Phakopsora pachyrhizi]
MGTKDTNEISKGDDQLELGSSIPPYTSHAVSVSLPFWKDNVDYELGSERVKSALTTGYPRFFIHLDIQKLAEIFRLAHGLYPSEKCMLFPSERAVKLCRDFIKDTYNKRKKDKVEEEDRLNSAKSICRIVQVEIPTSKQRSTTSDTKNFGTNSNLRVYCAFLPDERVYEIAKMFWQHTGLGISSRFGERCLRLLGSYQVGEEDSLNRSPPPNLRISSLPSPPPTPRSAGLRRYSANKLSNTPISRLLKTVSTTNSTNTKNETEGIDESSSTYVEERYGRNLPIQQAQMAKDSLRRRIASMLGNQLNRVSTIYSNDEGLKGSSTTRNKAKLTENDVYLYPTGMTAIFFAHQLCMNLQSKLKPDRSIGKTISFGFPYTDTLKIIQKWGPGAHLFGNGEDEDLESLERLLIEQSPEDSITALFCEFPSNPLLKSPDLRRLRELADRYGFLIVIDETIGNFLNVEVLPHADILVSSLTKVFSGDSNVMGGSLVLNPLKNHYDSLKLLMDVGDDKNKVEKIYEDIYFEEDVIYMERNSRDFKRRSRIINQNAVSLCKRLIELNSKFGDNVIKSINYPLYTTNKNYETYRRHKRLNCSILGTAVVVDGDDNNNNNKISEEEVLTDERIIKGDSQNFGEISDEEEVEEEGGYGGLFSLTFHSEEVSKKFYDSLKTYKGPSLGTNFTLASPYVILAHFTELDWASEFGVEASLIRVSVGLEDRSKLFEWFETAFNESI